MKRKRHRKLSKSQPAIEYSGDFLHANSWLRVGVPKSMMRELVAAGKRWGLKEAPAATAARLLLYAAVMHLDEMQCKLAALQEFASQLGFLTFGDHCDRSIRSKNN